MSWPTIQRNVLLAELTLKILPYHIASILFIELWYILVNDTMKARSFT